jgi:hypothetical protein
MVMGVVVVYSALMPSASPHEPKGDTSEVPVLNDLGLLLTAVVWTMVGIALVAWPARLRSLTNPDWQRYKDWPLVTTSLVWYRVGGVVLAALGAGLMFVLFNRVH